MHDMPQPSWWNRNWKWFVPTGCLFIVLLTVGSAAALMSFVFGMMKSSDAYEHAVAAARANPAVVEALGSPITEGFFVSGEVNVNGASGKADLAIPVTGPKASGTIFVDARKSAGEWHFTTLVVEVEPGNERIDLLDGPE